MTFMDQLKRKAQELDLQRKADQLADAAAKAAHQARQKAGELAHDHRDKVAEVVDKTGAKVDERTQGRYAAQVAKVRQQVVRGVDKLAQQRGSKGPGQGGVPPQDFTG